MKQIEAETVRYGIAHEELLTNIHKEGLNNNCLVNDGLCTEGRREACDNICLCMNEIQSLENSITFARAVSRANDETPDEETERIEHLKATRNEVSEGAYKACKKFTFRNILQITQEGNQITAEEFKKYGRKVQQKQ